MVQTSAWRRSSDGYEYALLKADHECLSGDAYLGSNLTVQECAIKCAETPRCQYFIFGKQTKAGLCYHEQTASAECTEGWEADEYEFFQLGAIGHIRPW